MSQDYDLGIYYVAHTLNSLHAQVARFKRTRKPKHRKACEAALAILTAQFGPEIRERQLRAIAKRNEQTLRARP